jgi:hypothetical protein
MSKQSRMASVSPFVKHGCDLMALHKRAIFGLSTWYRLQAVVDGCPVSLLQAVTEWRSFRVASY